LREQEGEQGYDLNAALRQARDAVLARGATALLVVPGDLPLVTPEAIETLIATGRRRGGSVVVAPARDGRGTNALLLSPPDALDFSFGPDSAQRHIAAARANGLRGSRLRVAVHEAAEFALDLDTPSDLEAVARLQGQWLDSGTRHEARGM